MTASTPPNQGLEDLQPTSRAVVMSQRPFSAPVTKQSRSSIHSDSSSSIPSTPDRSLSSTEIEVLFCRKVPEMLDDLREAFEALDPEGVSAVTQGEFRRVIEGFLLPLSHSQFYSLLAKVPIRQNGTVPYEEFLRKYCRATRGNSRQPASPGDCCTLLAELQHRLKDKIGSNLKNIVKAFQLFDYNDDGRIQKHELRRVLESFCFPMSSKEFEKLWSHYIKSNMRTLSYREFLESLGMDCAQPGMFIPEPASPALNWETDSQHESRQRNGADSWAAAAKCIPFQDLTLDEMQTLFLQRMLVHYTDVRKALQSFDVTHSGFVSQENLKSVLSDFLFPMNDLIFRSLARQYKVKPTGPVPWREFLAQFQASPKERDQRSPELGDVAQEWADQPNIDAVLQKLQEQSQDVTTQLKKAFLVFDENQDGTVTPAEMRKVVEGMAFPMTDQQFQELLLQLEAQQSNVVHYQRFLDLLEPQGRTVVAQREQGRGTQTPQVERESSENDAWSTVESLLRDKVSDQLSTVIEALEIHDPDRIGVIGQAEFKEVIEHYGLPLSDSHFRRLCKPCIESGGVRYLQFLRSLGLSEKRTDALKSASLLDRSARLDIFKARAVEEELLKTLCKKLSVRKSSVKNFLMEMASRSGGVLSVSGLRDILEEAEIQFSERNFRILIKALGFRNGQMPFSQFLAKCEGSQRSTSNAAKETLARLMTAEECLSQMSERIKKIYGDIVSAFMTIDKDHDRLINRLDFRELFESLRFVTKETEFQRLLDMVGLGPGATLNYEEFHKALASKGAVEEEVKPCSRRDRLLSQACHQVHGYLVSKVQRNWWEIAQTLCKVRDGNMVIPKMSLRKLLYTYALPITPYEYDQLWSRYDKEGRGYVSQENFLRELGVLQETTETLNGVGSMSRPASTDSLTVHKKMTHRNVLTGHSTGKDVYLGCRGVTPDEESLEGLSTERALDRMRELVTASSDILSKAFSAFDKTRSGKIELLEFRQVLDHFCARLSGQQFRHLLKKLDVNESENTIDWRNFLQNFPLSSQEILTPQTAEEWKERVEKVAPSREAYLLPMSDILGRIHEVVSAHLYTIAKEMADLDHTCSHVISRDNFRLLCDRHFMRLTNEQFEKLWNKLPVNQFGKLEYHEFLNMFNKGSWIKLSGPETERAATAPPALCRPKTASPSIGHGSRQRGESRVERPYTAGSRVTAPSVQRIRGQVQRCWWEIHKRCREVDTEGRGEVTMECFKAILQELSVEIPHLEQLTLRHGFNRTGKFSYIDFLSHFVLTLKPKQKLLSGRHELPQSWPQMCAGVLNRQCVDAMLRMQGHMQSYWRALRRNFVSLDTTKRGWISVQDFKKVLKKLRVCTSEEDLFHLCSFFDRNISGKISYYDFLATFLF